MLSDLIGGDGAVLVLLGKHPIYLRGSCGGHATLVSISTLLHASTTMNELVMKGCGSHSRQQGSRMPAEADPWGSRTWQWERGGLQSPCSEVGPGELLAGEGLESRKLGGTLRRMMNIRASTHPTPALLPLFSIHHL